MTGSWFKQEARRANVRLWKVAEQMGVSDGTLCKWLRKDDISEERSEMLLNALNVLRDLRKGGGQK